MVTTQPARVQEGPAALEDLRRLAGAGRLFAILDACDAPAVPAKVRELGEARALCLYRGDAEEAHWDIAPFLVHVDGDVLEWVRATLWHEPWGIFAAADTDLETLRKHFRRFLLVQAPNGKQWYFRYYDPRVLQTFLATCRVEELHELFGLVEAYYVTDAVTGHLTVLRR